MKPSEAKVKKIQDWLFDYLSPEGGLDPYDFHEYIPEWMKAARIRWKGEDRPMADDLKPAQLKKFKQWLIDKEKGIEWVSTGDIYAPAYLYFSEVKKLPTGTWCLHFTNRDPFDAFEYGTTLEGMALSTHKRDKDAVDCERNLSEDIGVAETIFGFAFQALGGQAGMTRLDIMSYGLSKYGDNAILFQTDGGVRAWHVGDEEYQVIFPLCSEYGVIPLMNPDPAEIKIQTEGGEEAVFGSIEEVIKYIESGERQMMGSNPSRRLIRIDE